MAKSIKRKIFYSVPYDTNKNIGTYYNDFMELLPNNDCWAVFVDGDTIFTTYNYGQQIEDVINAHQKDYDCLTCMTNRLGRREQTIEGTWNSDDIVYHRLVGEELSKELGLTVDDITNWKEPIGGVMIAVKKSAWKKVGGFSENGMLGVDNDIHYKIRDNGLKIGLMRGVYLYHWYRGGDQSNKKHLQK